MMLTKIDNFQQTLVFKYQIFIQTINILIRVLADFR